MPPGFSPLLPIGSCLAEVPQREQNAKQAIEKQVRPACAEFRTPGPDGCALLRGRSDGAADSAAQQPQSQHREPDGHRACIVLLLRSARDALSQRTYSSP